MAKDIKSIDVQNDAEEFYIELFQKFGWELKSSQRVFNQNTTPVGAISYEGYTYVHSETNTVDFTKLVFERDKKIPHYNELVELEAEFWDLSQIVSAGKPNLPPQATTMEGWANYAEPELRSKAEKRIPHIIFGILLPIEIYTPMLLTEFGIIQTEQFPASMLLLSVGLTILIWKLVCSSRRKHALRSAIRPGNSKYRQRLAALYEEVIDRIDTYDRSYRRMGEIVIEAEDLLEI